MYGKTLQVLLLLLLTATFVSSAEVEDQVHFPISGYNNHNWYSGRFSFMQDISTSPQVPFITFSSILKEIQTMIPSFFG